MPLVFEAHGDAVLAEAPQRLFQAIVKFPRPLAASRLKKLGIRPREYKKTRGGRSGTTMAQSTASQADSRIG